MKTILIPVDFSEAANNAMRYAVDLAATLPAPVDLVLVHVYPKRESLPTAAEEAELSELLTAEEAAQARLDAYALEHARHAGIRSCKARVATGQLSTVLTRTARLISADLILMGTKGGFSQGSYFASNNSSELVDHAPCPVLVVPQGLPFRPLLKMIFAADFSGSNLRVLQQVAKLAGTLNTQLQVVHISAPGEETTEIARITRFWSDVQQQVDYPWLEFANLEAEQITDGLEQFAFEQNADLVVVCPKRRSVYYQLSNPSTTRQLVLDALIPVLALPRTDLDQLLDQEELENQAMPLEELGLT